MLSFMAICSFLPVGIYCCSWQYAELPGLGHIFHGCMPDCQSSSSPVQKLAHGYPWKLLVNEYKYKTSYVRFYIKRHTYKVNISILSSDLITSFSLFFVHMMGFIAWKPQKGLLKREIGVQALWHCEWAFTIAWIPMLKMQIRDGR